MATLEELFGTQGGPGLSPELEQSISQVNSNIAGLLQRSSQGPNVGDIGRSLLMSAGYGGQIPHTKFLQDDMAQQYQMVGQQAQLVSQSTELYMKAAESKAQGNPLAAYIANTYKELLQEDPYKADQWVQAMINDPEPASMDMVSRHLQAVQPRTAPKLVEQDIGDQTVSGFLDEEGNLVPSPLTGQDLTTAPRYKPETNITNQYKPPAQYPNPPIGWYYTEIPEEGKPLKLAKIPNGPITDVMDAARAQALTEGLKDIDTALEIFMPGASINADTGEFTPGQINRSTLFSADLNWWKSEGRRGAQAIKRAVDAAVKLRTGAGQSIPEAESYWEQFAPSSKDNDQAIIDKMSRLASFLKGTKDIATKGYREDTNNNGGGGLPTITEIDTMSEDQLDEFLKQNGQ
jgi:hypothetical protein